MKNINHDWKSKKDEIGNKKVKIARKRREIARNISENTIIYFEIARNVFAIART